VPLEYGLYAEKYSAEYDRAKSLLSDTTLNWGKYFEIRLLPPVETLCIELETWLRVHETIGEPLPPVSKFSRHHADSLISCYQYGFSYSFEKVELLKWRYQELADTSDEIRVDHSGTPLLESAERNSLATARKFIRTLQELDNNKTDWKEWEIYFGALAELVRAMRNQHISLQIAILSLESQAKPFRKILDWFLDNLIPKILAAILAALSVALLFSANE